jgi:hypothetical protein
MLEHFIDYTPEYIDSDGQKYLVFLHPRMHPFSNQLTAIKLNPTATKEQVAALRWSETRDEVLFAQGEKKIFELSYFKRFQFVIHLCFKWPLLILIIGAFTFVGFKTDFNFEFYILCALHLPWFVPVVLSKITPLARPVIKNA